MSHIVMLISNPFRPDPRSFKQAESLIKNGFQITILGWDRAAQMQPEETLSGGIRVIRIQNVRSAYGIGSRQLLRLLGFWRTALPILNCLKPDLIHCHNFDTLPIGLLWGRLHRVPVIYDAREYFAELVRPRLQGLSGRLLYRLIHILEPLGARLSSAVVTVDESLGAVFRKLNQRVVIIGHYPTQAMTAQAAPVFTRPNLTLLYAGRLSADRGLLVYAELLRLLRASGLPAHLILAGSFTPAAEEQAFRARLPGLEPFVEFSGWIPFEQIPALLCKADVGLAILQPLPRYIAALPIKLFEYMAVGLPVVASHFPLVASVLEETGAGVTVDPTYPEEAADCIKAWWRDPAKAREAGEKGRQAVLHKYNWESLVEQLADLYRTLL